MKGAGHFALGFLLAYAAIVLADRLAPSVWWRLYGPFVPFGVGAYAAVPYAAKLAGLIDASSPLGVAWNVFVFYPALEHSRLMTRVLGEFHISAALVAMTYTHLLWRYIGLIKEARQPRA